MGQAKQRGTFEERKAKAVERKAKAQELHVVEYTPEQIKAIANLEMLIAATAGNIPLPIKIPR